MPTVHTMAAGEGEKGQASGRANGLPGPVCPQKLAQAPFLAFANAHWQEAIGAGSTLTDQDRADNAFSSSPKQWQ